MMRQIKSTWGYCAEGCALPSGTDGEKITGFCADPDQPCDFAIDAPGEVRRDQPIVVDITETQLCGEIAQRSTFPALQEKFKGGTFSASCLPELRQMIDGRVACEGEA